MNKDILKLDRIVYKDQEYVVIDYEDNGTTIGKDLDFGMKEGFLSKRSSLREYLLELCLKDNKLFCVKKIASAAAGGWKHSEQIFIPYTGNLVIATEEGIAEPVSIESFLDSETAFELQLSQGELVREVNLSSAIEEWKFCVEAGDNSSKSYFAQKHLEGVYNSTLGYNSKVMLTDEAELDFNFSFDYSEETEESTADISDLEKRRTGQEQKSSKVKKYDYQKGLKIKSVHQQKKKADSGKKYVNAVEKILASRFEKLGHYYLDRETTKRNERRAFLLCLKAAKLDNKTAMLDLGYCYLHGIGTAKNKSLALKWFQNLAHKGEAIGCLAVYYLLEDESSNLFDIRLANHYLGSAARLNSSEAMRLLAANFRIGRGVRKDISEAMYWYKKAIINGSEKAILELARLYDRELKDQENAFDWYLIAAEKDDSMAAFEVAFRYETGTGTKQDRIKARYWYKKAAGLGNSLAKERLLHLGPDGSDNLDSYQ